MGKKHIDSSLREIPHRRLVLKISRNKTHVHIHLGMCQTETSRLSSVYYCTLFWFIDNGLKNIDIRNIFADNYRLAELTF